MEIQRNYRKFVMQPRIDVADLIEAVKEQRHTIHTKIPALETAMVLQGEKIAEQAARIKELEAAND